MNNNYIYICMYWILNSLIKYTGYMFHVSKTLSNITAGLFSYWLPASATSLILFLRQNKHRHLTQNF